MQNEKIINRSSKQKTNDITKNEDRFVNNEEMKNEEKKNINIYFFIVFSNKVYIAVHLCRWLWHVMQLRCLYQQSHQQQIQHQYQHHLVKIPMMVNNKYTQLIIYHKLN